MQEPNNHRFDRGLRAKATGYEKQPSDQLWEKIQPQVGPPARSRWYRYLLPLAAAILLLLTANLLPSVLDLRSDKAPVRPGTGAAGTVAERQRPAAAGQAANRPAQHSAGKRAAGQASSVAAPAEQVLAAPAAGGTRPAARPLRHSVTALPGTKAGRAHKAPEENAGRSYLAVPLHQEPQPVRDIHLPEAPAAEPAAATPIAALPGHNVPPALERLVATEQQAALLLAAMQKSGPEQAQLVFLLQQEKAELARLQTRADSLLRLLAPEAEQPALASADTAAAALPRSRWSVLLMVAPEYNFMRLAAPATDTLMRLRSNHEAGGSGKNAALSLEYRLSDRLSIGAGLGYSSFGAELRLTDRKMQVEVRYDTTTTITTHHQTQSHTVFMIEEKRVLVLDPRFNASGQIIGYDSLYVMRPDTVWTTTVLEAADTSRQVTITPEVTRREVTTYKVLRPQYHFVTLPVLLRYRFTSGTRWWADVTAGGQLQLFRGGTQLVTEDGRTYRTEKVKPNEGPFRPVNISLMGSLTLNYGLTKRLSLSAAPAVRWQVQSVYKKETGLQQRPLATGLQFGLRYAL